MLPKISGYRVCQQLRAEQNWVPILILSAKDGEYDQADGLDLGADDYLTKPFSYVVLAARLRALLRRGAVPRPAELQAGDLSLDPASRRVRRGRDRDRADRARVRLLEYLIRRAGQVVSKSQLLEHVWDSYDALTSTWSRCTRAISGARSTPRSAAGALQTVRGAGLPAGRRRRLTAAERHCLMGQELDR